MGLRLLLAALLFILPAAPVSAAGCDFFKGIWATGTAQDRIIFYLDDVGSITQRHNAFFERWTGGKRTARMYGYLVASMGGMNEGLVIEKSYHPYLQDEQGDFSDNVLTSVLMERLSSGEEPPQTLVFAGLNAALWNRGSDHIEFFDVIDDPDHAMAGPNAFEFLGCRTRPVDVVSSEPWIHAGPLQDSAGTYCTARSPGGLMLRVNAGNDGMGIAALELGNRAISAKDGSARALIQIDGQYTAWVKASVIEKRREGGKGNASREVFVWSYDSHLIEAIRGGRRLMLKAGDDVLFDQNLDRQPGALFTLALDGSAKALAALQQCVAGP